VSWWTKQYTYWHYLICYIHSTCDWSVAVLDLCFRPPWCRIHGHDLQDCFEMIMIGIYSQRSKVSTESIGEWYA
jgi:hypothetical protein